MKLWQRITGDYWQPRRTIWPYREGYGCWNAKRRTLVDDGLSLEQARQNCRELNRAGIKPRRPGPQD